MEVGYCQTVLIRLFWIVLESMPKTFFIRLLVLFLWIEIYGITMLNMVRYCILNIKMIIHRMSFMDIICRKETRGMKR